MQVERSRTVDDPFHNRVGMTIDEELGRWWVFCGVCRQVKVDGCRGRRPRRVSSRITTVALRRTPTDVLLGLPYVLHVLLLVLTVCCVVSRW